MLDLTALWSGNGFVPHGHCYLWLRPLVWLHLMSDSLIAVAYYLIPLALIQFARRRQDLPFRGVFWLFGAFIVACGTTHLMDVWTLWYPVYWLTGGLKLITAVISIITAVTLYRLMPQALTIPSATEWEATTRQLQAEIAQHQRTSAALQEAQRLTRLGSWEFILATEQITWSTELFHLFGYDPEDGEPLFVDHLQTFTPQSREVLQPVIDRAAQDGTPYEVELQFYRTDGSTGWVLARGEVSRNERGEIYRLWGTALDITARKQAEEQLRIVSDRLTLAIKSGAIAIWDWDVIADEHTWDERMYELYAATPDDTANDTYGFWASRVHPDDLASTEAAIRQALRGERDYDYEFRIVLPDGSTRYLKAYAVVQRNEHGTAQHITGINLDCTESKRVECELRALNQLKDDFLSTVSHELRTPLASIKMAGHMITLALQTGQPPLAQVWGDALTNRLSQYLGILKTEANRELKLINELLELQRLEVGDLMLTYEAFDLGAVLTTLHEQYQAIALNNRQQLCWQLASTLPVVSNEALLTSVLRELLANACKYTPTQGLITVQTTQTAHGIELTVSNDTGTAIPTEALERLFDKFYRVPTTDQWRQGGTGLGLALVKRQVTYLGGELTVASTDHAIRFCLVLPWNPSEPKGKGSEATMRGSF